MRASRSSSRVRSPKSSLRRPFAARRVSSSWKSRSPAVTTPCANQIVQRCRARCTERPKRRGERSPVPGAWARRSRPRREQRCRRHRAEPGHRVDRVGHTRSPSRMFPEPALEEPGVHASHRHQSRSCVPCSTISPRSKTSTRSACSAAESRCAIVTVVRPADNRLSASVMRASVAGSTALVASSRINRPGSAICARTSAISCRSPTESCSPRSPARVSSSSWSERTHSPSPARTLRRPRDRWRPRARP